MNAIALLKHQHREVEALFKQLHKAKTGVPRRNIFEKIADALAVHATIEEKRFYPAVKEKTTEEILRESVEEHLAMKRVIADLLRLDAEDETFAAKIKVLEDEITHHVEEEEEMLFPRVERMFDDEALESLGRRDGRHPGRAAFRRATRANPWPPRPSGPRRSDGGPGRRALRRSRTAAPVRRRRRQPAGGARRRGSTRRPRTAFASPAPSARP